LLHDVTDLRSDIAARGRRAASATGAALPPLMLLEITVDVVA
jgi:hypothetical protein